MEFELSTLGTASALPIANRYPSAHVLNIRGRLFLIDCGEGCQMLMRKWGFSMEKIDNIFISHLHGDHVFGLFGLLSSMAMKGRTAQLTIHAPREFGAILDFFLKQFGGDAVKFEIKHNILDSKEPEKVFEARNIEAFAFPLNHRMPTYGFLFREKEPRPNIYKELIEPNNITLSEIGKLKNGIDVVREDGTVFEAAKCTYRPFVPRSFAYCSDTAPFEKLTEWIRGADLLYHEATFAEAMSEMAAATFHSTTLQSAETARKAQVGKLVIGHFSSRYFHLEELLAEAKSIFSETFIAEEGTKFPIELKKF